jgi:hypothetical protein
MTNTGFQKIKVALLILLAEVWAQFYSTSFIVAVIIRHTVMASYNYFVIGIFTDLLALD